MRRFVIDNFIQLAIFLFGVASLFYRLESNFAFVFNYEKKEVAKLAFICGHNRTIVPYFRFREGIFHQLESLLSRESAYELTLVSWIVCYSIGWWEAAHHVCVTRLPCSVTSGQRPHYNCKLINRDLGRRDWGAICRNDFVNVHTVCTGSKEGVLRAEAQLSN